jgi:phosphoribosylanthranilate isomerase
MMVKICGITNREDARAAVDGGASALGFNFYPRSPRYIKPHDAQEIVTAVPAGTWKVGIFVEDRPEWISAVVSFLGLDVAQVHGENCLAPPGVRIWRALRAGPGFQLADLEKREAEAYLLDTPSETAHGGTGTTFDWTMARGAARKVIVAGGLDESNVRQAIEQAQPWGVDACSRLESSPGRKDHARLARFLKAALSS